MQVRLLREAGGLGDVVRALAVARAVKRADPKGIVGFWYLEQYKSFPEMCPDVDLIRSVRKKERRDCSATPDPSRHRYLSDGRRWDATVSLYCPGWEHERATTGRPTKDRIECFVDEATRTTGLALAPTVARLEPGERVRGMAEGYLLGLGLDASKPIVGLEMHSSQAERRWTNLGWAWVVAWIKRALPWVQLLSFAPRPEVARASRDLGLPCALRPEYPLLVALVARCSLIVGVDSGLMHIAATQYVPHVGLYGFSTGSVIIKQYPLASAVCATDYGGLPCGGPCNALRGRGPECRNVGCWAMNRVAPEAVAEAVLERLSQIG